MQLYVKEQVVMNYQPVSLYIQLEGYFLMRTLNESHLMCHDLITYQSKMLFSKSISAMKSPHHHNQASV